MLWFCCNEILGDALADLHFLIALFDCGFERALRGFFVLAF